MRLVSAGHRRHRVTILWLYANGTDLFVPLPDVTDFWEVLPPGAGRAT